MYVHQLVPRYTKIKAFGIMNRVCVYKAIKKMSLGCAQTIKHIFDHGHYVCVKVTHTKKEGVGNTSGVCPVLFTDDHRLL